MEILAAATYATSKPRALAGFAAGAVTGGFIVALHYLWSLTETLGVDHLREYGLSKGTTVFVTASIFWAIGLAVFGVPFWVWLHRRHMRRWPTAVLTGIAAGSLGTLLLQVLLTSGSASDSGGPTIIDGHLTLHGWIETLQISALFGVIGGIVASVIWRIAYRRHPANA